MPYQDYYGSKVIDLRENDDKPDYPYDRDRTRRQSQYSISVRTTMGLRHSSVG